MAHTVILHLLQLLHGQPAFHCVLSHLTLPSFLLLALIIDLLLQATATTASTTASIHVMNVLNGESLIHPLLVLMVGLLRALKVYLVVFQEVFHLFGGVDWFAYLVAAKAGVLALSLRYRCGWVDEMPRRFLRRVILWPRLLLLRRLRSQNHINFFNVV